MPEQYLEKTIYENPDTDTSGHYADMMMLGCVDFRLWEDTAACLKQLGVTADLRLTEGSVCYLCGHKHGLPDLQQGSIDWIKGLRRLHGFSVLGLMIHDQCGAYKAAPALAGLSAEQVEAVQLADLAEASGLITAAIPDLRIRMFRMILNQSGRGVKVVELELAASGQRAAAA